jgi:hypothetical protein
MSFVAISLPIKIIILMDISAISILYYLLQIFFFSGSHK